MEQKFLIIAFLTTCLLSSTIAAQQNKYSTAFVKKACSSATYPAACLKSLLPYATTVNTNNVQLVTAALSTALNSAGASLTTATQLSKMQGISKLEASVLSDCINEMKDSMDQIKNSITEISHFDNSGDKGRIISDANTWTSTAMTDGDTCLDGSSDPRINPIIKQQIKNSIDNFEKLCSNALYLINHLSV